MNEIVTKAENIETMIYEIRGVQVMLDSDLAKLYKCDTGYLNRARKRNIKRFPDYFAFQINKEEYINLKCQIGISKVDLRRINRNLPYVYTEQGVSMLSAILHTEIAMYVSVQIIDSFVKMRRYISTNLLEQKYINNIVLENHENIKLLRSSVYKLEQTFEKMSEHQTVNSIFFAGQIFDAYIFLLDLLSKAKDEVIIIDNYAGKELFKIIKDVKVKVIIVSKNIDNETVKKYQKQYSNLVIKFNDSFHDRFIILDKKILYHSGASFKDLGVKCFAISLIEESTILSKILEEVNK
jgi:hypothetical protein